MLLHERALLPYRETRERPTIGTFDIETDGLYGDFIYGALYAPSVSSEVSYFGSIEGLVTALMSHRYRGVIWYAHNGGGYDFKYLLLDHVHNYLEDRGISFDIRVVGGSVRGLTLRNGHKSTNLRDSYALLPQSLKALTKSFGVSHGKLAGTVDWNTERFDPDNPEHIRYLEHDVIGLHEVLEAFTTTLFERFRVYPTLTAPSTAMRAFQAQMGEDDIYWRTDELVEDVVREAYYGGMVRPMDTNTHDRVISLDVASMYAAMGKLPVPTGRPHFTRKRRSPNAKHGFYHVVAHVPASCRISPLSRRTKSGIAFPRGNFLTFASGIELDFAVKVGVTYEVLYGVEWFQEAAVLKNFMDTCETLRQEDYSGALGQTVKFIQNAFTGKLGQRREQQRATYCIRPPDNTWVPADFVDVDKLQLWTKDVVVDAGYMHPHWVATITARSRVFVMSAIYTVGVEKFLYCDTDSLVLKSNADLSRLNIGNDYGQWKLEGEGRHFTVAAPKCYAVERHGQPLVHVKGIPVRLVTTEMIVEAARGHPPSLNLTQAQGFMTVARSSPSDRKLTKATERKISNPFNMHGFTVDPLTHECWPIIIEEFEGVPEGCPTYGGGDHVVY